MLAIIWHSRTGTAEALARAAKEGAGDGAVLLCAEDVSPDDLLEAQGYLFACPENLATMSGMMKEMFDRCYYPVLGKIEGRPYATLIAAGSDGSGAQAAGECASELRAAVERGAWGEFLSADGEGGADGKEDGGKGGV